MNIRLKQLRILSNLTQQQLADKVGLDRTTICKIEGGTRCSLPVALAISKALNTTVEDLFGQLFDNHVRNSRKCKSEIA